MVTRLNVTAKQLGPSNLIAAVCYELQIPHYVNSLVQWDEKQWKVSPGTLILGLIINILVQRKPLYLVEEFYKNMDLPMLFDEPVVASDFNDDALGRALDRIVDGKTLFKTVACQATIVDNIEIRTVHADTTSISLYGEFVPSDCDVLFEEATGKRLLNITHGYSKQHRPDLKQFVYGLLVSGDGLPLVANVNDGNASDKIWNKEIFDEIETSFLDPKGILYVADSALVTLENLSLMAKKQIRFISRLPENFAIAKTLKEEAWQKGKWESLGAIAQGKNAAQYWTSSLVDEIDGRQYRFVVVRSSALDKRREKSLEKQLNKEFTELEKAKKELEKQEFSCRPDAEMILAKFLDDYKQVAHSLFGEILEYKVTKRKPGRPRMGEEPPTVTRYRIELDITEPTAAKLKELRERASTFVLITTESADVWSDLDILKEYKGQSKVETRFRFLKHPLIVNDIYLKSPRRIEALAYVVMLALLVAAFIERRVRFALDKSKQIIEILGKRKTNRPTIKVILDMLSIVNIVYVSDGSEVMRILPDNTPPNVLQLIELAGHTSSIYTTPIKTRPT